MVNRGDIWWTDLPVPIGSGPGYRRPAVIISADRFNRSRIRTVVVAIVSSNVARARAAGNVLIKKSRDGLRQDSVVNITSLFTIDRALLLERCAVLTAEQMKAVDEGLRLSLDLHSV